MEDIGSLFREYGHLVSKHTASGLSTVEASRRAELESFLEQVIPRQRLDESLGRAQRLEAIGQLASGIAHDFNNLLTAMGFYADLQLAQLEAGNASHDAARQIRAAVDRASRLTAQLLNYGGRNAGPAQRIDLNGAVRGISALLERLIGQTVSVRVELENDSTFVRADPAQIEQILMNLALNARDAMPAGGTLRIATRVVSAAEARAVGASRDPRRYVRLTVADTGVGMDEAIRERVFEPFFTTKPVGEGTGLGLVTVGSIVAGYGGVIRVDSQRGSGTRFDVYLPLAT